MTISNQTSAMGYSSTLQLERLFTQAKANERILQRFQQFELGLLDCASLDEMLRYLLVSGPAHFHIQGIELYLYDPQGIITELLPSNAEYLPYLKLFKTITTIERLYPSTQTVLLLNRQGVEQLQILNQYFVQSAAVLPLRRHGALVGSLHFGAEKASRYAADYATEFITHLAAIVAVCLENTVNQDRLTRLSMIDMLTKVKNRRAFHIALFKEISRCNRGGEPLSLLVIDLDYFKKVNDQYGHLNGDKVLKEVAQFIDSMQRRTDYLCRYGGEEFVLILPNCPQAKAVTIAERIRKAVSELPIALENEQCLSVTLSIGATTFTGSSKYQGKPAEQAVANQLIAAADAGVYQAKAAGRNRVCYQAMQLPIRHIK